MEESGPRCIDFVAAPLAAAAEGWIACTAAAALASSLYRYLSKRIPPTPAEVDAFVADKEINILAFLVDVMLEVEFL